MKLLKKIEEEELKALCVDTAVDLGIIGVGFNDGLVRFYNHEGEKLGYSSLISIDKAIN